jgi:methionyl-tRNA formyltransferase
MKNIFFVVNTIGDVNFSELLKKYLPNCSISVGDRLPVHASEFDLIVLWSYRKKIAIEENTRNIILFHSSPLPVGRGWAPIYNSIAKRLSHYTISGIFAAQELDAGDLIVQARFAIQDHYVAADLRKWDAEICVMLIEKILKKSELGPIAAKKQEGEPSTWPRRKPAENEIDVRRPFADVIPHLRACEEDHPAFFMLDKCKYSVTVKSEKAADFPRDLEIEFFDSAQLAPARK